MPVRSRSARESGSSPKVPIRHADPRLRLVRTQGDHHGSLVGGLGLNLVDGAVASRLDRCHLEVGHGIGDGRADLAGGNAKSCMARPVL